MVRQIVSQKILNLHLNVCALGVMDLILGCVFKGPSGEKEKDVACRKSRIKQSFFGKMRLEFILKMYITLTLFANKDYVIENLLLICPY